jgi:hypothetical protein
MYGSVLGMRIRIQESKMPHRLYKVKKFMVEYARCTLLKDEGFSCGLDIIYGGQLYGTAESRIFHRTPAGHTAEKKTRRKRNRGCYGLLSVPRQPSSSPHSSPPQCASIAPPAATLSGLAEGRLLPPPTVPPPHG